MKAFFITSITIIVVILLCLALADFGTFSTAVQGPEIIDLICLGIFILIISFICTYKYWSKTARKNIITCIVIYCCLNVFTVWSNFGIMCIKRDREGARRKACWSNIRLITGAVEMYNMDNSVMMENLDLQRLFNDGYLGEEFSFPSDYCNYTNIDNLSDTGFVCCTEHFSPNTELYHLGYCILYENMNKDNYKDYIGRDSNIPFEKIQELKDKFNKAKESAGSRYDQRNLVTEQNRIIRAKKPFLERTRLHFKENKDTYLKIFLPFVVLFFPYLLHPLR